MILQAWESENLPTFVDGVPVEVQILLTLESADCGHYNAVFTVVNHGRDLTSMEEFVKNQISQNDHISMRMLSIEEIDARLDNVIEGCHDETSEGS